MKRLLKKIPLAKEVRAVWNELKSSGDIVGSLQERWSDLSYKQLPPQAPTEKEHRLIEALRQAIRAIPLETPSTSTPNAEKKWMGFKNELREKILHEDPRAFLTWDVVKSTMGGSLRRRDYQDLVRLPFWKEWESLITKLPLINEKPYFKNQKISGTILAQARNLAQIPLRSGQRAADFKCIVEFGAGYGGMCALINALGFSGIYVIYDWPEFLLLQKFYLAMHNIDISRVRFVSNSADLRDALAEVSQDESLLIATWSLSEVSEAQRNEFFSIIKATSYLLAYQKSFGGVDNRTYFETFAHGRPNIHWNDYPIPNLPGEESRYLIGSKKISPHL